jgi:hypothetical protein
MNRRFQSIRVNTDRPGEAGNGFCRNQIAIGDMAADVATTGPYHAKSIFSDKFPIADQVTRLFGGYSLRPEHFQHEIMVGNRLVQESPARRVDRDNSRLGAIRSKMREQPLCSVSPARARNRRPDR